MLKKLVIIGAGGVGRESALIVEDINDISNEWDLLGFVDDNISLNGKYINGYEVLGGLDYILKYKGEIYVVCAITNYEIKKSIVNRVLKSNINVKFANIIHPTSSLNRTVSIGEGCIIYQGNVITANIEIGNHVMISPKCGIGHDSVIGNYCSLLWNVNISGNVSLGEGVIMGSGSTIIQGKKVDRESFIGAGAVVIKDIKSFSRAVGVPSRYIKEMGEYYEEGTVCDNYSNNY